MTTHPSLTHTGSLYLPQPSSYFTVRVDLGVLPAALNTSATTDEENVSAGLAIKELVAKVLPSTYAEKDSKTYALKNIPKDKLASMESFKMYLAERLDLTDGIGKVGYYLRGGK